jgi:hypothetical protein
MNSLLKDLWIHHILPVLSPIDLCHFQLVSKRALQLTLSFQPLLNKWKQNVLTNTHNFSLFQASQEGHKDLVQLFMKKGACEWNLGLNGASQGGHQDIIQLLINKGANDWNLGLYGVALGGHKDLVNFFIDKGANDWRLGLSGASLGGHKDLIEFFQNKLL